MFFHFFRLPFFSLLFCLVLKDNHKESRSLAGTLKRHTHKIFLNMRMGQLCRDRKIIMLVKKYCAWTNSVRATLEP